MKSTRSNENLRNKQIVEINQINEINDDDYTSLNHSMTQSNKNQELMIEPNTKNHKSISNSRDQHFRQGIIENKLESGTALMKDKKQEFDESSRGKVSHKLYLIDENDKNLSDRNSINRPKLKIDKEYNEEFLLEEKIYVQKNKIEKVSEKEILDEIVKMSNNVFERNEMKNFLIRYIKRFTLRPIKKGRTFMCNIVRNNKGLQKLYPKYKLVVYNNNRVIMVSKKVIKSATSKYEFSDIDENYSSQNIIGRLISNFFGTEFNLYNEGKDPKDIKTTLDTRQQYGCITYETNLFGIKGPTNLKVYSPEVNNENNDFHVFKPNKKDENIHFKYKNGEKANINRLINKSAEWSEKYNGYVLKFNGRVNLKSTKNFQLIEEKNKQTRTVLQFGKISENAFALDFQHPLSPLQAFAICISALDRKLACE